MSGRDNLLRAVGLLELRDELDVLLVGLLGGDALVELLLPGVPHRLALFFTEKVTRQPNSATIASIRSSCEQDGEDRMKLSP